MADFNKAVDHVIKVEGGYSDHKDDPGRQTKYGITQKTLEEWNTLRGVDSFPVRFLHAAQAREIYRGLYWDKLYLDEVQSQALATIVFDQAVNQGLDRATKRLQRALNYTVRGSHLVVDGKMGPKTLDTASRATRMTSLQFIYDSQIFYARLVKQNKKFSVFLEGWLKRTHALFAVALTW